MSILNRTKKILGLAEDYTAFDIDIITHINSTFSVMGQLGIVPTEGEFYLDYENGSTKTWEDFHVPENQRMIAQTYMYLRVRYLFDPPTTSYLLDAMEKQIRELEWRMNIMREDLIPYPDELLNPNPLEGSP